MEPFNHPDDLPHQEVDILDQPPLEDGEEERNEDLVDHEVENEEVDDDNGN